MPLKVLSVLDAAKIRYYHFKAIIVAGMGIFADAYDLFCIPPITRLLGHVYYKSRDHHILRGVEATMLAVALLGTVIGQLVFGRLGDRIGRRRVYGLSLMLMITGSIGCGLSVGTTQGRVLASLGFFRFLLGIGIGGDYPLSATIMAEFANKRLRGGFIAAVFSMQGFGILASSIVTMVMCTIFGQKDLKTSDADLAWRLILMLGAVPTALTYYWRMMMPETARYTALVELNVLKAARDMEPVLDVSLSQIAEDHLIPPSPPSYRLFSKQFFLLHGRDLLACSISWFLLDIVFYINNLCQPHIYKMYLHKMYLHNEKAGEALTAFQAAEALTAFQAAEALTAFQAAFEVARLQAIVVVGSTIPGYFAAVYLIDRVGRVRIQAVGFLFMAIAYFFIGNIHWKHHGGLFMFVYCLTFFFSNCGPNTTTFIVPAELFPARFRSTCHGIAGAVGKVGAMIGAVGFLMATHNDDEFGSDMTLSMRVMLNILGGICVVGMVVTMLFTRETMGRSLEENENANESKDES
ncbi:probable inorganic phosphate transporter 1-8 [Rhodamnia argentea]|uniref:Probable inorganic phosphate transporter 1-8 n=1 Tax=Rhodamnia argentea TaxID=178133 RepID=A0A8B8P057_9MYRT|nr:probable inorganic phosphate transporter 1-8 [Rhodamnia argentea]